MHVSGGGIVYRENCTFPVPWMLSLQLSSCIFPPGVQLQKSRVSLQLRVGSRKPALTSAAASGALVV